jgi:hypothetical protein
MTARNKNRPRRRESQETAQLREQVERKRLERQLKQEEKLAKLTESAFFSYTGASFGDWVDPRDAWRDAYEAGLPALIQSPQDRLRGADYIAFRNEEDLREIRYFARWLEAANVFGMAPLNAIQNKVVNKGFTSRAIARTGQVPSKEALAQVQGELDRFDDFNLWPEREREVFRRSRVDGVSDMRHFATGPVLQVRRIEPEQIVQPFGVEWGREWAFGVHCNPDDAEDRWGYFYSPDGDPNDGEEVPAHEIESFQVNTTRATRRGLSDFFAIVELADDLRKLMRNMNRGAALIAAIAWIEQFETASKEQVQSFGDDVKEFDRADPRTGQTIDYERFAPGTIIRTGKGKTYTPPPLATANTPQIVEIGRQARLAIACRWNAPEVIFGDASNGNYSSLGVAESPFVATAEVEQQFYAARIRRIKLRALQHAIDRGRLPADILGQVDVSVEPPAIVSRDRLQQAQERHIELADGIIGPQTWCQELGYVFEEQQQEIARARALGWTPPAPPGIQAGGSSGGEGTPAALGEGAVRGPFASWRRLTGTS